jgi:hypothetical protein
MGALLLLYLVFTAFAGTRLILADEPAAKAIGVALIVLALLGLGFAGVEFRFGFRSEALARQLEAQGGLPEEQLPARSSGRIERDAADASFARYAAETQSHPESWPHWFRLSLAYDAARDRRRARWAMREAIRLARDGGAI